MAKKGQPQALQLEIHNEEEWENLLKRPGLIVTDVYSEWCGPCSAMSGNLKKVKMEIGGDNLILASAKADKISCLQRFRNRSEPTWMFISNRKMVALMFGANAPRLMNMIAEELEKEKRSQVGEEVDRLQLDFEELTPEEQARLQVEEDARKEAERIEEAARLKAIADKKINQCNHFLEHLNNIGIVLFYPHAGSDGMATISDQWDKFNLSAFSLGRPKITKEILADLFFFEEHFPEDHIDALINGESLVCLVRPKDEEFDGNIDQLVLQAAYGEMKEPPGDEDSVARKVYGRVAKESRGECEEEEDEGPEIAGLWAPTNNLSKAMAIHMIFPEETKNYILEETESPPPVVAVIFDAHKRREVFETAKQFPNDITKYGFFTSVNADKSVLISKTIEDFDAKPAFTYTEKMVVQVSKRQLEPLMALVDLVPCYISPNTVAGELECKLFFPEGYDAPEVVEKKAEKKSSKKRRSRGSGDGHKLQHRTTSPETVAGDLEASGIMEELENENLLDAATSPLLDAAEHSTDVETSLLPEEEGDISE